MKIDVRITKDGAVNYIDEEIDIAKPIEEWTKSELFELTQKMQHFLGAGDAVRRCEDIDGLGYRVSVAVGPSKAETQPLELSETLAGESIWERP